MRSWSRNGSWATLGVLALVAVLGIAVGTGVAQSAGLETTSLEVYTSRDPQLATQIEVANVKGFFAEEGLTVSIRYLSGGGEIPPAMARGSIKLAIAAHNNALNLISQRLPSPSNPTIVIGQVSNLTYSQGLAVRTSLNLQSPKDLEGKRLGTFVYASTKDWLAKFGERYGVDVSKIQLVNLQPPDIPAVFARGDIDAALIWEPHLTRTVNQGGTIMATGGSVRFPTVQDDYIFFRLPISIFTTKEFADAHPNTLTAFLRAIVRANELIENDREQALDILTVQLDIPRDDLARMMNNNQYYVALTPDVYEALDYIAQAYYEQGEIPTLPRAKDYVRPEFLRRVDPALAP